MNLHCSRTLLLLLVLITRPVQAQLLDSYNASAIKLDLKKLGVLGSVLYIGAHPDDENTAMLAAFAQGCLYRTAYLSITRGEGGQNLLGPEQGASLGLIRTQELLAARKIDGAEQYFTRAVDFGFSKTRSETLRFWGEEKTLSDVVWIIRTFRPDVIVTRFTPLLGGHGNHTASAFLAEEAFHAAADSTRFPEQLKFVSPWQAKRIVWNVFRFSNDTLQKAPSFPSIDLGGYSPVLGKSFTEIAGESRSMHKSQGFGAAQNRGEFMNYFQPVAGDSAKTDLFDGVNTTWARLTDADRLQYIFDEAYAKFDDEHPDRSIPLLFKALQRMASLKPDPWVTQKKKELTNIILACAGVSIEAITQDDAVVPGNEVKFRATIVNRLSYPFVLQRIVLPLGGIDTTIQKKLETNQPVSVNFSMNIPASTSYTQPYWLVNKPEPGSYSIADQHLIGQPENVPPVVMNVLLASQDGVLEIPVPLRQKIVDPVEGELLNPLNVIPPVMVNLDESVLVFPEKAERQIHVTLKAGMANVKGIVRLKVPESWISIPAQIPFDIREKDGEHAVSFTVRPLQDAKSGSFTAEAAIGTAILNQGIEIIKYKHIPPQAFFPVAEGKLLRIDLKQSGKNVGYIMGAGDEVPEAIRQMGYTLTFVSDAELAEGNLDQYDIIVAGVRAYNTRPQLRLYQSRLMQYVQQGGTYIVQYVTPKKGESDNIGPYPMNISRDRVAEEDAVVTFLKPDQTLLLAPNKITDEDFKDWIQERGLSFADHWDARYDSLLSCHDKDEPARAGGLLMTNYGKGYYVYCAYALFRQLPAGVAGAYRLFANILSLHAQRRHEANASSRK
jgi:LmbE family N-acetylglucosaminyl deacetylase